MRNKTLPATYYLDHFHEFLGFFEGANRALLTCEAHAFIRDFRALCKDQQCLIARAANRKYAVINRHHFNYAEIDTPQAHLDALTETGWFGDIAQASLTDIAGALTKDAIITLLRPDGAGSLNARKKDDLVLLLESQVRVHGWPSSLPEDYLVSRFNDTLRYLLFLYFGHSKGRLNQFSMRDLGIMRTRADATQDSARFDDKDEAVRAWTYVNDYQRVPFWSDTEKLVAARTEMPVLRSPAAQQYRNRYLLRLGLALLATEPDTALSVLAQADSDEAQEKWIREAYKAGRKDEVKARLETLIDTPPSDTLLAFAEDFYARKFHKKRTSAVTDMLRSASRTLDLDESHRHEVEAGVLGFYRREGLHCWRTENRLWRSLFGLTFWPLLFERDVLVTEFDRRPQSLKHNTFYTQFSEDIEALLNTLTDTTALMQHVTRMAGAHYGKVNALFMWHQRLLETISALLDHAPLHSVITLLRMMSEDFAGLSDGFPDIMVFDGEILRFEEIKAPGDQLRRNQLTTIQRMQQAGFEVNITQVNWVRDPNQPYVVVDIETTGGNNAYHRITEIGMVKMQHGEIIDRYQTLLNPQRRIPKSITRLTGIDDAMVADAPLFSEVADIIDEFTEGCVFVAHNVNFDFGFIRQEFARLERTFRRPKLCTVREMRRAKPGLPSYSLAALTAQFGIKMDRHHRAMSDAQAAAELLTIVHAAQ
ncbi:exonuclease domain-containing protein [Alteromonas halophila]|uniref:DNA-directed DNA polymerase n=1 Tax=Alteromonas halophila TaxID=516698 RepID=A0A918MZP0_9ALTE|nr:exonuclease domain-containing protein [Alteromonas halophila]GGW90565.1 hypothetical protein GCM10007391_26000 [Alteromonas halophila]